MGGGGHRGVQRGPRNFRGTQGSDGGTTQSPLTTLPTPPPGPPLPPRLLLQAGYDPDVRDKDGWTPLHAAAHWGVEEACALLAEHLCDMAPRNNVVCVGGCHLRGFGGSQGGWEGCEGPWGGSVGGWEGPAGSLGGD